MKPTDTLFAERAGEGDQEASTWAVSFDFSVCFVCLKNTLRKNRPF